MGTQSWDNWDIWWYMMIYDDWISKSWWHTRYWRDECPELARHFGENSYSTEVLTLPLQNSPATTIRLIPVVRFLSQLYPSSQGLRVSQGTQCGVTAWENGVASENNNVQFIVEFTIKTSISRRLSSQPRGWLSDGFRWCIHVHPIFFLCFFMVSQGLLNVPFWVYWTSPYSSHYRPYT